MTTTERNPHPHAEVIKAWADGYEIQFWGVSAQRWHDTTYPEFSPHMKYRIKPEPKMPTTWYQVVYRSRREGGYSGAQLHGESGLGCLPGFL